MDIKKNEILFIYNSKLHSDKKALGYIVPLDDHKIKEFDLHNDSLTELQLKEIADRMKIKIEELLDENSDAYQETVKGKRLDPHDLLKVIKENPDVMKTPLALTSDKAVYVTDPYSLIQDDMEVDGVKRGYKS